MIYKARSFLAIFLLLITTLILTVTLYIQINFSNQSIDEIIFTAFNGIKGASPEVIKSAIMQSVLPFIIIFLLLLIPLTKFQKKNYYIDLYFRKKQFSINLLPFDKFSKYKLSYSLALLIFASILSVKILNIEEYVSRVSQYSTIFEEYYVDGRDITIEFPEEKRNLIILYLESMENTMIDEKSGGGWKYNVIPELTAIAENNINFSNTNRIGGAYPVIGTDWTIAGMVSTTSGIPLKIPIYGNSYTDTDNFLAGAYSLGDVLEKEGYKQALMVGSDADYGGRSYYYQSHGKHEIFDVKRAIQEGRMTEDEQVWWGFDDHELFEWAKEEIVEYANKDVPFSFTFLTANTHFPDGYVESEMDNNFETQYENVHAHSSKQVGEFVSWLEEQDFYDNTTLVIIGDHLSMQPPEFYDSKINENYTRTIYNAFINSPVSPINPKNRIFTQVDMYPTILASIGVHIEGDRLGLGTNLFSNKQTLAEELGYENFSDELSRNSHFYNQNILKDDYLRLLKKANEEEN